MRTSKNLFCSNKLLTQVMDFLATTKKMEEREKQINDISVVTDLLFKVLYFCDYYAYLRYEKSKLSGYIRNSNKYNISENLTFANGKHDDHHGYAHLLHAF